MKILIIGYGSAGRRHASILNKNHDVDIVTHQECDTFKVYKNFEDIQKLSDYDYFIIASVTNKHYRDIDYINEKVKNKVILAEKPLFSTYKNDLKLNNQIYLAYNLRFHPIIEQLRFEIKNDSIISINAYVGQYLPDWRKDRDYKKTYSAQKSEGGGVLLDLSHEIDLIQWLAGELDEVKSFQGKISNLEINSDDIVSFIGKTKSNTLITCSMDYISKTPIRRLIIHTVENTYELDLIYSTINGKKIITDSLESYKKMHNEILFERIKNICSYEEGLSVMKTIQKVQDNE
jgi:predicted dehydrogenase